MKKKNWFIVLFAVVLAIVLVALYLALGFLADDHGLDIVLAIVWLVLVAVFAGIVQWRESIRRRLVRRFFVCDDMLFNAELGRADKEEIAVVGDEDRYAIFAGKALASLNYDFDIVDRPENFEPHYFIDSDTFKFRRTDGDKLDIEKWSGSISRIEKEEDGEERIVKLGEYDGVNSLTSLLKSTQVFA